MKKKLKKAIIITALIALVLSVPIIIFHTRAPVLIVSDEVFIGFYGDKRIRREAFFASIVLFRNVKTVSVVDDAADDIIALAVQGRAAQPYCVLFPFRFADSAAIYHSQNPDISVILLEGRDIDNKNRSASSNSDIINFLKYKNDIESDYYKAGVLAAAFKLPSDPESEESLPAEIKKRTVILFLESRLNSLYGPKIRESFQRGLNEHENPPEFMFYTSYSSYTEISSLSCVVLSGIGSEFLENKNGIPVIVFTWLNPALLTSSAAVVVNDSPWAQVVQAVKMLEAGVTDGLLKSKFVVVSGNKKADKDVLNKVKEIR